MTTRFAKTFAAAATIAALAIPAAAQASHGADDPVGHEHQGQVVFTTPAAKQKVHKHKHKHHRRHRHARGADDNLRNRARGADDNAPRGGGADDPVGHR